MSRPDGLGLLSTKAEATGSDTVHRVTPCGYSLSRGGHDPGSWTMPSASRM